MNWNTRLNQIESLVASIKGQPEPTGKFAHRMLEEAHDSLLDVWYEVDPDSEEDEEPTLSAAERNPSLTGRSGLADCDPRSNQVYGDEL